MRRHTLDLEQMRGVEGKIFVGGVIRNPNWDNCASYTIFQKQYPFYQPPPPQVSYPPLIIIYAIPLFREEFGVIHDAILIRINST